MSSQNGEGIPFSISQSQQNVRLLELPPALLELLTAPSPPTLAIKSSAPVSSSSSHSSPSSSGYAVLCTPTQTYNLRQVQTSNSVFVTQPYTDDKTEDEVLNPEIVPEHGICAIASCPHILEAIPQPPSPKTAASQLRQLLAIWDGPEAQRSQRNSGLDTGSFRSKNSIFGDTPLSDSECNAAWVSLCAFEDAQGRSWGPTAEARIGAWQALLQWMVAQGWDMKTTCKTWEEGHSVRVGRMLGQVKDEGWPEGLLKAVFRRVGALGENENPELNRVRVDSSTLVPWIGEMLLAARQNTGAIPTMDFLSDWKEHLPEPWANETSLDAIQGSFMQPSSSTIQYRQETKTFDTAPTNLPSGKSTNRKWHEKFKQTRK